MTNLVNLDCNSKSFKVRMEVDLDGVNVYAYMKKESVLPEFDYYLDNVEMAKDFSLERFGASLDGWVEE